MLIFIDNKWFRANYGKKLRAHMAASAAVRVIADFRDLPVFENTAAYAMIFVAQKGRKPGSIRYAEVASLDDPYPDVKAVVARDGYELAPDALAGENWTLADSATRTRLQIMSKGSTTLGEYVRGHIFRGVLTGLNKAFVIDGRKRAELISRDPQSDEIIMQLTSGKEIRKWSIKPTDRWLIFTRHGTRIDDYPAVKAHLERWKTELTPKPKGAPKTALGRKAGHYEWYEIQDSIEYHAEFSRPKIVYQKFQVKPAFAFDTRGVVTNDATYIYVRGFLSLRDIQL